MRAVHNQVSDGGGENLLHAKFGPVLESVSAALMMVDARGCIALANKHVEELFGYTREELIGKPAEDLLAERFRGRQEIHGVGTPAEIAALRKDGSEFPVEISLSPVQMEEGAWTMTTIRDMSDRKRLQQELKEKNAALAAANQELQAFSYSVSHDLRAPLRAMGGFAGMLRKSFGTNITPNTDHALKRIEDNVSRMSKLIDGLLDFSSLSFMAMTRRKADPGELARSVFNELTVPAERGVDFEVEPLPGCIADVVLLRQVFTNLLSNAVKFTRGRERALIRVGSIKQNGEIVFYVRDNGVGFDMDYADKLFRVFQRLHSASDFEGAGVGLAIVQRIVQRHGGRVWAEGRVDEGATFYFTLGE